LRKKILTAAAAAALLSSAGAAQAQFFGGPSRQPAEAAPAPDTSSILRIDRLENQVRGLNGQVEQLQFQVRRLEDQLRKFQADVDSRLLDSSAKPAPAAPRPAATQPTPQRRSDLSDGIADGAPAVAANVPPPVEMEEPVPAAPESVADISAAPAAPAPAAMGADGRRHDAFDPSGQPNAPGAPLALGSADSASKPVARAAVSRQESPSGPLDLTPPSLRNANAPAAAEAAPGPVATLAPNAAGSVSGAPAPTADPTKTQYDFAADQLKAQRYDAAQQAFSAFVQKNPHSRLIAPAIYHLGESYYYQNRHREAAEQFLKIATDFSKSAVAPEAMVKLGLSLNALGAKEQACAFFSEMPRKYPNAPNAQKLAAEREAKKASC
jgi:tol-pal system protein YbgF